MNRLLVLVLFQILFLHLVTAQLEENFFGGYLLEGKQYIEKKDILLLLQDSPEALAYYKNHLDWNKKANQALGTGVAMIGLGALLAVSSSSGSDPDPAPLVLGIGSGLVGLIAIGLGSFRKSKSFKARKKVIPYFNADDNKLKSTNNPTQICLVSSHNGLGIRINW